ncbi:hypothetical protein CQA38_03030 [Campylobacter sp. MIT 12-5580]|uniref:hypothetical protein n=1 Tax=Campylobacter sp. MIT 12-5580 TaxID=2040651 RepID=UPI0010F6E422|nr:hypothetical protein [Campylobacter sp. MIT 12-5580]TKX29762.1 hypothetical protein CQA38_03030 [Campylobacter sp. MIT 12-5580]
MFINTAQSSQTQLSYKQHIKALEQSFLDEWFANSSAVLPKELASYYEQEHIKDMNALNKQLDFYEDNKDYTIKVPKEELEKSNKAVLIFAKRTQTPFSSVLSQKQERASEAQHNEAALSLLATAKKLTALVTEQQGLDSKLGSELTTMQAELMNRQNNIMKAQNELNFALNSSYKDLEGIAQTLRGYFTMNKAFAEQMIHFFDYASDKFQGLDTQKIMQDLATIKGYWDNNTASDLTLGNGTKIGLSYEYNAQEQKTQTFLKINNQSFALKENSSLLENTSFNILLNMFENTNSKTQPEQSALQRALKELG